MIFSPAPSATEFNDALRAERSLLWCDVPAPNSEIASLPIAISGWAYSSRGITGVVVALGEHVVAAARHGLARPDVACALGEPDAMRSGFMVTIFPLDLAPGQHTLTIVAEDGSGASTGLTIRVNVTARAREGAPDGALKRELIQELHRAPWMYEWQLSPGVTTPLHGENLRVVHQTRAEIIEQPIRAALAAAGPTARALDLACNEGWFSQRLLEWGAADVIGIDLREENVHRAKLIRDHLGIPAERLSFEVANVLDLDSAELGEFDVVLMLGLIYHLEQPLEAIRQACRLTRRMCVIESQLTRQSDPIVYGDGSPDLLFRAPASFAAWVEGRPENPLASWGGVMSLVPNLAALMSMPLWAGFSTVMQLSPEPHHDPQYLLGDRAIVVASN